MKRSGPQYALNKERTAFQLPPRRKKTNPQAGKTGIYERLKAGIAVILPKNWPDMASERTQRRIESIT